MLMNNLDPEVAENPDELVVYGGHGKAARNWECFDVIVAELMKLESDETLLVQSGKPIGVVKTHADAPRVLIANSNLVPHWATQKVFDDLEKRGLIMFGQMTAGSWIYIGTQGILQGTYETFAEVGRQHFGGTLAGRLCVTAGCGGMGGAQPLAITMAGGTCLIADVDEEKLKKRVHDRYLDEIATSINDAIDRVIRYASARRARSVGVTANASKLLEHLLAKQVVPAVLTDQTSAHDPLNGYVPADIHLKSASLLRASDPEKYLRRSLATMKSHVRSMVALKKKGAVVFDYGNNLRQRAHDQGLQEAFSFPGFVPAYIRPQFCLGRGPFRWVALSGDPVDIAATDEALMKLFPKDKGLHRWLKMAAKRVAFQGLPARICWLGLGERHKAGLLFNEMVADGRIKAPIVIGRDHLDCGSVASPNRETEAMKDGSDAISDWAILNALVNTASGASWVSFHHGGGVGIGFSQHAGQVIVADGTPDAARRIERVLKNDPTIGDLPPCGCRVREGVGLRRSAGGPDSDSYCVMTGKVQSWLPDLILKDGRLESDIALVADAEGKILRLSREKDDLANAERLVGRAILPGFVNAHSHSFQRAIRGRTEYRPTNSRDTFWTWREKMYHTANGLTPEGLYATARMCFLEMALAGITTVGEFHYLHHQADGTRYPDPNLLAKAVVRAAREVGLRIALLQSGYARSGCGTAPHPGQKRFLYRNTGEFLENLIQLRSSLKSHYSPNEAWVGIAPHSLRAVSLDDFRELHQFGRSEKIPIHMHASEQLAENEECIRENNDSPIALLAQKGFLNEGFTAIHAIHLTQTEIDALGFNGANVCACPTTERNLGDGIVQANWMLSSGVNLALGSDSQIQIDPLEDARELEYHLRLSTRERSILATPGASEKDPNHLANVLIHCATAAGAKALFAPGGSLVAGQVADFICIDLKDPSIAGLGRSVGTLAFSLGRSAICDVAVGGRFIVKDGHHAKQNSIVEHFEAAQRALWGDK